MNTPSSRSGYLSRRSLLKGLALGTGAALLRNSSWAALAAGPAPVATTTGGKVAWSCTQGGTARSAGATYTFPTAAQGVITKGGGGSVIMAEVNYSYSLPVNLSIPGILNLSGPYALSNVFFSKPRKVLQVPLSSCP